jgi:hypothetical protein
MMAEAEAGDPSVRDEENADNREEEEEEDEDEQNVSFRQIRYGMESFYAIVKPGKAAFSCSGRFGLRSRSIRKATG